MPVITYKNIPVTCGTTSYNQYPYSIKPFCAPATNVTVSLQNALQPSRVLAANQNNGLSVGGELKTKINMSFVACNKEDGAIYRYNFANEVLNYLTGTGYVDYMWIGSGFFEKCYLESASVEVTPFAPIIVNAEFTCLAPPTGLYMGAATGNPLAENLSDYIAYGYLTTVSGGSTLFDSNQESVSYSVSCNRTYSTSIGQTTPNNIFLNAIEKQMNVKARNLGKIINFEGYGAQVIIEPRNARDEIVINDGFGVSANSRITSQNFSVSEGDIFGGEVSITEVVL